MSEVKRLAPSGGLLLTVLALVTPRPASPGWAWTLVTVVTALAVVAVIIGLVRDMRGGGA